MDASYYTQIPHEVNQTAHRIVEERARSRRRVKFKTALRNGKTFSRPPAARFRASGVLEGDFFRGGLVQKLAQSEFY